MRCERSVVGWCCVLGAIVLAACGDKDPVDTGIDADTDTDVDTDTDTDVDTDTGDSAAGMVSVSPSTIAFDAVQWGCDALSTVSVSNIGTGDLTLSTLDLSTVEVFAHTDLALPIVLHPGEVQEVTIEFRGEYVEIGAHTATLTVGTDDALTPESLVEITGDVAEGSVFEESFVSRAEQVDILFTFDRSCGMYDDGVYVTETFSSFVETLDDHGADYRIALSVADDGCIVGPDLYIDDTVSPEDAADVIWTMLDLDHSKAPGKRNAERPFALMEAALSQDDTGGCNEGLLRAGADLVLVGIGDEPEQSPNTWENYLAIFEDAVTGDALVTVNGLGADGCNSGLPEPRFYGFDDAVYATGGVLFDLCYYDRPTTFEGLADHSIGRRAVYPLSETPGTTPTVLVDGVESTDGVYSSSPPEIRFSSEDAPSPLSTVDVTYPVSSCL